MSDKLASLADKDAAEKKNREEKKRQAREERHRPRSSASRTSVRAYSLSETPAASAISCCV